MIIILVILGLIIAFGGTIMDCYYIFTGRVPPDMETLIREIAKDQREREELFAEREGK